MSSRINTRILVIDDEESVRDSFRMVLGARPPDDRALEDAASALFDEPSSASRRRPSGLAFEVHTAPSGQEGAAMVRAAAEEGRPYAVVFCDIRMPGWDGIETAQEIRRHDQRVELVFVTAYSDHSIETVIERAGADVGYFVKPFLTDEVKQLATKLVLVWNKARELEELMVTVTSLRGEAEDIDRLLRYLLSQICAWLDTDSAALLQLVPAGSVEFRLGIGQLGDRTLVEELLTRVSVSATEAMTQLSDGTVFLPIPQFGLAIALSNGGKITPDRRFLLQVFLEHAALALRNNEIRVRLVENERMAAIGQAFAFLLHDIRGPVGMAQTLTRLLRSGSNVLGPPTEVLGLIDRYTQRALDMVGDTLDICHERTVVSPSTVDIIPVIREKARVWRVELDPRGIALELDVPVELTAHVDGARFDRALWNLIKNAADALAGVDGPCIRIQAARLDGRVDVCVEDNGPGIRAELLPVLFQPFASAKLGGTGFGLTIVREIVRAHGGDVTVEALAPGTRFRMSFPEGSAGG